MADYKNLTSKLTDIKPTSAAPGTTSFASTQPVAVSWYGTMYRGEAIHTVEAFGTTCGYVDAWAKIGGEASILGSPTNSMFLSSWRSVLPVTASTTPVLETVSTYTKSRGSRSSTRWTKISEIRPT